MRWSLSFVAILAYVYASVTYGLPLVGPAVVAALIGLLLEKERLVFPPFMLFFLLYIVWSAFGYMNSYAPTRSWEQIQVLLKIAIIAFAMVNAIRDSWRARMFAIFFLGCFAAYPVRGTLFNYFIAGYTHFGRALWNFIYNNSNDLAALTFFPLSLTVALALTERPGWIRRAAIAGVGVLPLMILLTQSRGALIGLVFALVLFFLMHSSGKRVRTLLSALALAVLVLPLVPDSAWERFSGLKFLTSTETVAEADPEGSAEARYHIWRVARALVGDHPVTGVGIGAYSTAHSQYAPRLNVPPAALGNKDTHSTYLNVAAETGLFGALIFMTMIAVVMIDADVTRRRARNTYRAQQLLALELGLLAFMLAGIFGSFAKLSSLYVQLTFIWVTARLTKQELASGELREGVKLAPAPDPARRARPVGRARRAG